MQSNTPNFTHVLATCVSELKTIENSPASQPFGGKSLQIFIYIIYAYLVFQHQRLMPINLFFETRIKLFV